ncbi:MAG TPA: nicotinamide-nucleotide amidohydrolase family protein [Euryarchaeota archaeon]|nr:MAG: hypothetical protein B6U90_04720 [Thermoplasmatales archaeon ex4484_6]RLF68433.1 MAG: hypothetical protein DRN57_04065 [Thermoplasmata archaeon]HHD15137.1 nicotinamide-nucleotide amidohydrolase family protein [Euryarchaeota archaeon]
MACAESCTGGFISSAITDVSGASSCFMGSVIAYSNDVKKDILGVANETIDAHGAVSMECAREMVEGVERLFGSDLSLSVTGIAGPEGGTDAKPVGTVFIGVKERGSPPHVEGFLLGGLSRKGFKKEVSDRALGMLFGHALSLSSVE